MDVLRDRRRALMAAAGPAPSELYPVGTDVKAMYAPYPGSWSGSHAISQSTGEIISGSAYVNPNYIPVDPSYTYQKNGQRMHYSAWYDENYVFISAFYEYNISVKSLPAAPANAAYLRIAAANGTAASSLKITRTA
jgi:hypothetical protein